ncbi:MAG: metalloregulator ArsR/SmtB family transcription factor [Acidimicrobiales bacterium]
MATTASSSSSGLCCPPLERGPLDENQATELAGVFKALADPIRLRLVSIIAAAPTGEACACDLPVRVERSQATVSHHLTVLTRAGILDREQRGKWAWFRVRPGRLAALGTVLAGAGPDPAG